MSGKVDDRNRRILGAAVELAAAGSYQHITREQVAERAGVATGSVNNAYGTMAALRDAVVAEAVAAEHLGIVGQALAAGHPAARAAPPGLKDSALRSLAA